MNVLLIGPIWLGIGIVFFIGILIGIAGLLAFNDGRRTLRKFWYLSKSLLKLDMGLRGLARLIIFSIITASIPALGKGFSNGGFDWHLFLYVLIGVVVLTMMNNLLSTSRTFQDFFSPKSGRKWLNQRKSAMAGIIKRIDINLDQGANLSAQEFRAILTDILDVVVLHVRDYRGSHDDKNRDVFANLLIEDGSDLVVVARDSLAHSTAFERPIPARYPKAAMLCGRAMISRKVLSVGLLKDEYPEAPRNKPYESILAIPLFSSEDECYGAISIDCSKPYFFQSFTPGVAEDAMENHLQPYLQLITMTLDCFAGRSIKAFKGRLL